MLDIAALIRKAIGQPDTKYYSLRRHLMDVETVAQTKKRECYQSDPDKQEHVTELRERLNQAKMFLPSPDDRERLLRAFDRLPLRAPYPKTLEEERAGIDYDKIVLTNQFGQLACLNDELQEFVDQSLAEKLLEAKKTIDGRIPDGEYFKCPKVPPTMRLKFNREVIFTSSFDISIDKFTPDLPGYKRVEAEAQKLGLKTSVDRCYTTSWWGMYPDTTSELGIIVENK